MGPPAMYQLDEREAFAAMAAFLWQYAERAGDDLVTLLADIALDENGDTADPAAWDDWIASIRGVTQ